MNKMKNGNPDCIECWLIRGIDVEMSKLFDTVGVFISVATVYVCPICGHVTTERWYVSHKEKRRMIEEAD